MRRIISISMLAVTAASAQMIYGDWFCKAQNWSLVLTEDGNYSSQYQGGSSVGHYFLDENSITFQDAYTYNAFTYTLQFAGDVMQFTDQMGGQYVFTRVGSEAEALDPGTQLEGPSSYEAPELASKDGYVLREDHVKAGIDILELAIGELISEDEAGVLLDAWIGDFNQEPESVYEDLNELIGLRDKLYTITDPWEVAMLRASLVGAFHNEAEKTPREEWHEFLKVMYDHVEVVAFDETNQLAFTDKDLDAYLDYLAFLAVLNTGNSLTWSQEQRSSIAQEVAENFPKMSLDEKKLLCGMDVMTMYMDYAWNHANASARSQIAQSIAGNDLAPGIDYSTFSPSAGTNTAGEMDDDTYKLLHDLMLEDHAASMNVISSIGGGPDYYYEVVESEY
ncbi:hypothetical protein GF359_03795 [candidate division WOR-3 bacterium]|uniref:Uncharacterized protein n=1 Tax=candidate division WOR-3 bacterium TaxID=2052148 RepID=A0A9D5QC99_UNCW3|nr:hypothetical protein [candidate division WOR-3 bacterium]MBD3364319.1 hypothetical protein [candidate division WOR-3 bacterium]